ncbi:MAG: endonuclease NucS [archaeon]
MAFRLAEAKEKICSSIDSGRMLIVIGNCFVQYQGRAGSKLAEGKRMLLIKGDKSFAIHQNTKLRPINYMMNATASVVLDNEKNALVISASKRKPKEKIDVFFYSIDFAESFEIEGEKELRLFGSEKELSDLLMQDLSVLEQGLIPLKNEVALRKGTVDIMAEDKNNNLVVIEVKRRRADLNSVRQLHSYMHQVQSMKERKTRGILCAPSIGNPAMELLEKYGLEYCRLDYEISNPHAEIKGLHKKQFTLTELQEKK